MYYPQISPTSPVSRDDLAQIIAMQQMGLAGGQQPGDASSLDVGSLMGANTPSFESGMPGGPGFGSSFGGGGKSSGFGGGAMTTSNASMVGDPADQSPTFTEPDAVGVPGYSPTGYDTSQQSQDKQAADRAAISEAVANQGMIPSSDPLEAATQAYGGNFGRSFEGFSPVGTPGTPGVPAGYSTTAQPGATPVTTTSFTQSGGGAQDNSDIVGSIMGAVTGSVADLHAMGQPAPDQFGTNTPGWGAPNDGSPTLSTVGAITPGGNAPAAPGGSGGGGFDQAGTVGSIMGNVTGSVADLNAMGGGGYGGFSSTGGYEGSASMSNTGGAQGFGGGGAVGGFGGGAGDTSGAGSGDAGGGGGGGGGGMDAGGSPGGVG